MARYEFEAVLTGRDELSPVLDHASESIGDVRDDIESLDGTEARLSLEVNSEETLTDLDAVDDRMGSLDGTTATLEIVLDTRDTITDISTVEDRLDRVDGRRVVAEADLDTRPFIEAADAVEDRHGRLDGLLSTAHATLDAREFMERADNVERRLGRLDGLEASPNASLNDTPYHEQSRLVEVRHGQLDDLQAMLRASLNANAFHQRALEVDERMGALGETTIEPVMDMDPEPFMADAGMVQGVIDQLSSGISVDASMDTAGFMAQASGVQTIISSIDGQEIEVSTNLDYAPMMTGLNMISGALSDTNDQADKTSTTFGKFMKRVEDFDSRAAKAFPTAMGDFSAAMERFDMIAAVVQTTRLPGLMQGITVLATGATAGAAAAGGLAVALSQGLAGGAGVAAGAMGLLGTSLIGTIIPTKNVISTSMEMQASLAEANATLMTADPASREYQGAMATVAEITDQSNAKFLEFGETMNAFRRDWMMMNREIGERSLPVLTDYVEYAHDMLPRIGGMIEEINKGFREQARILLEDLQGDQQIQIIAAAMQEMGEAGDNAFRLLFQGARLFFNTLTPVLGYSNDLLRYLGLLTQQAADWSATAEGQAAIADVWQRLVMRGMDLWQIVRDLSVGIFQLGQALDNSGLDDQMIEALQFIASGFRDITTAGTETHTNLMEFFADIRPLLDDVGHLIMAVGEGFFSLVGKVANFRQEGEKLTVLQEIVRALEDTLVGKEGDGSGGLLGALWVNFQRLGPVLADLVEEFAEFFAVFGPADPILVEMLRGFEQLLSLFNELPPEMQLIIGRAIGMAYAFNMLTGGGGRGGGGLIGAAASALSFGIQMRTLNTIARNTAPTVAGAGGAIGGAGRNARTARGGMAAFGASLANLLVPGRAANRQVAVLTPAMTRAGNAARGAGQNARGAAGGWTALGGAARSSSSGFIASGRAADRSRRQIAQSGAAARTAGTRYGQLGGAARGVGGPMIFAGGAAASAGRGFAGSGRAAANARGGFGGLRGVAAGLGGILLGAGTAAAASGRGIRGSGTAARGAVGPFGALRGAAGGLAGVLGGMGPMALLTLVMMFPGAFAQMANGALNAIPAILGLATGTGNAKTHFDNLRNAGREVNNGLRELQGGLDALSRDLVTSIPALQGVEGALNQIDTATSNAAQGIRGWFIESMREARSESETTTHSLVGDWQGAKDKLVGNSIIPDLVIGIKDWFVELHNWLGETAVSALEELVSAFQGAYDRIVGNSIVPDLVKDVEKHLGTMPNRAANALKGVEQTIADPFRRAQGVVAGQVDKLSNMQIQGPTVQAAPAMAGVGGIGGRGGPGDEVRKTAEEVQKATLRMARDAESGAEKVRKGFLKGFQGLAKSGTRDLETLRKNSGKETDRMRKEVIKDSDDMRKGTLKSLDGLSKTGTREFGELRRGGGREVDRLRKDVTKDTGDLRKVSTRDLDQMARAGVREISELSRGGVRQMRSLRQSGGRETAGLRRESGRNVDMLRRDVVRDLGDAQKRGSAETESLKRNANRSTDQMRDFVTRQTGQMRAQGVKEFGNLKTGGTRESDTLKRNASRLTDEMKQFTNRKHTEMKDTGVNRFTELKTGGTRESDSLKQNANRLTDEMRQFTNQKHTEMKDTGIGRFTDLKTGGTNQSDELKRNASGHIDTMRGNVGTHITDMKDNGLTQMGEFRDRGGETMSAAGQRMSEPVGRAKTDTINHMNEMLQGMNAFIDETGVDVPKAGMIGGGGSRNTGGPAYEGTGDREAGFKEGGWVDPQGRIFRYASGGFAGGHAGPRQPRLHMWGEGDNEELYIPRNQERERMVPLIKKGAEWYNLQIIDPDPAPSQHLRPPPSPADVERTHRNAEHLEQQRQQNAAAIGSQEGYGPAMYTLIPPLREIADAVASKHNAPWNTYSNHPIGYPQPFYRERSVDFWGPAGRGDPIDSRWQAVQSDALGKIGNQIDWYLNPSNDPGEHGGINAHVHITAFTGNNSQGAVGSGPDYGAIFDRHVPETPDLVKHIVGDTAEKKLEELRTALRDKIVPAGGATGPITPFTGEWATAVGGGPSENRGIGQAAAREIGWENQWPAWDELGMRESGWDRFAENPSSGAYGIAQALPPTKYPPKAQKSGGSHAGPQVAWMADYIKGRYTDPQGALNFHNANNWYSEGGIATRPHVGVFGEQGPELFLPMHDPRAVSTFLRRMRDVLQSEDEEREHRRAGQDVRRPRAAQRDRDPNVSSAEFANTVNRTGPNRTRPQTRARKWWSGMSADEIEALPDNRRYQIPLNELPPPGPGKVWAEDRTRVPTSFYDRPARPAARRGGGGGGAQPTSKDSVVERVNSMPDNRRISLGKAGKLPAAPQGYAYAEDYSLVPTSYYNRQAGPQQARQQPAPQRRTNTVNQTTTQNQTDSQSQTNTNTQNNQGNAGGGDAKEEIAEVKRIVDRLIRDLDDKQEAMISVLKEIRDNPTELDPADINELAKKMGAAAASMIGGRKFGEVSYDAVGDQMSRRVGRVRR